MYLWELPFLLAGFYFLFVQKDKRPAYLLGMWFLLAPLPASVTVGLPTSIRTTIFLPVLQVITAYGMVNLLKKWKLAPILIAPVVVYFMAYYLHMYYVHAPVDRSKFWYSPYQDIVKTTYTLSGKYSKVIVSTRLDQPPKFLFILPKI